MTVGGGGSGAQLSPSDIATQLPRSKDGAAAVLDGLLRLLAAHSLLTCSVSRVESGGIERHYELLGREVLRGNENGVSFAQLRAFTSGHGSELSCLQSNQGMDMKMIEGNRLLFCFNHPVDRKRVLENAPWAYEKSLLVLKAVDSEENPMKADLDWCDFHVQIHDLPLGKMNRDFAQFIGNQIGRFKEVDTDKSEKLWGSSLRIRVSINITKPLRRVLRIRTEIGTIC
ncbi:UNVERIFIED_CONTAM: Caffeic acid 3-O-methyltransferase [Sesamum radiatum]|uniref:Caffeic acid 3-O-methyltransferase n=1 Tax=Sesamum radiatum TaxID=300843 RepID=A0AAW2R395_SESRA